MSISNRRLNKVRQSVVRDDTYTLLTKLLVEHGLSPLHRKVYRYICSHPGIEEAIVKERFDLSIGILTSLQELDLIVLGDGFCQVKDKPHLLA